MTTAEAAKTTVRTSQDDLLMASTKARNASVAYNMRAVGGLMGAERQLANFKKLRFENKYKDVPPEQKEELYLRETVDEFALTEAEDTERLHKVRQATAERRLNGQREAKRWELVLAEEQQRSISTKESDLQAYARFNWATAASLDGAIEVRAPSHL